MPHHHFLKLVQFLTQLLGRDAQDRPSPGARTIFGGTGPQVVEPAEPTDQAAHPQACIIQTLKVLGDGECGEMNGASGDAQPLGPMWSCEKMRFSLYTSGHNRQFVRISSMQAYMGHDDGPGGYTPCKNYVLHEHHRPHGMNENGIGHARLVARSPTKPLGQLLQALKGPA